MSISEPLPIGSPAPDFDLPGIDGQGHSLKDFAKARMLAVVFSCNHCPYVHAYESRLITLQKEFQTQGFQMVLINSNDSVKYPQDSFDYMVDRANQRGYNFPYLRDRSQEVARAYGGQCTPHVFLFDEQRKLVYQGGIDDSWDKEEKVTNRPLRAAILALLEGREVVVGSTLPRGCSIKWKG